MLGFSQPLAGFRNGKGTPFTASEDRLIVTTEAQVDSSPPGLLLYLPAKRKILIMHEDDIEKEHNLWDAEHPEWFIYDSELLNAWYWDEFIKEYDEENK